MNEKANAELSEISLQTQASQILQARAILDEIQRDVRSPVHDTKHPRHQLVSKVVADLEAELFRLTCVVEEKKDKRK